MLLLENLIRGGISSVMGPRYIESDENTKHLYIDANNLYGWEMSQCLPTSNFEKLYFPEEYELKQVVDDLRFFPDNTFGIFIECYMLYPAEIKEKTENFRLCFYQTTADPNLFSDYMNSVKQPNYKRTKKLLCDLTNNQKYMMHYKVFKFYTKMGLKKNKDTLTLAIQTITLVSNYITLIKTTKNAPKQKQSLKKTCTN